MGYSPWGCKESDTTEQLTHTHTHTHTHTPVDRRCFILTIVPTLSLEIRSVTCSTLADCPWLCMYSFPKGLFKINPLTLSHKRKTQSRGCSAQVPRIPSQAASTALFSHWPHRSKCRMTEGMVVPSEAVAAHEMEH